MPHLKHSYYAALLTIYTPDKEIDFETTRYYMEFLAKKRVKGFFACGTTGEFFSHTPEENLRLFSLALEVANPVGIPVIPCAGTPSFANTLALIQALQEKGAQSVSVCPPYYTPYNQQDVLAFYEALLAQTNIPFYLYNIPAFTNEISFSTFHKLLENPRIIGIKDSSGNMKTISRYLITAQTVQHPFRVMTGTDEMILPALAGGSYGSVSALSAIVPEVHNALYASWQTNLPYAQKLQHALTQLAMAAEEYVMPVGYKMLLSSRGFGNAFYRQAPWQMQQPELMDMKQKQMEALLQNALALAKETT